MTMSCCTETLVSSLFGLDCKWLHCYYHSCILHPHRVVDDVDVDAWLSFSKHTTCGVVVCVDCIVAFVVDCIVVVVVVATVFDVDVDNKTSKPCRKK